MSIGMILLIVIALLILFGVLQRTLDRMALTDRQAILIAAAVFAGGFVPDIPLGPVTLNIGGGLIPLLVSVYLFFHADTRRERGRCIIAALLTAAGVFLIGRFFPADPVSMPFDPLLLYGIAGGVIAWLFGRSRRSAFIAGILGLVLADTLSAVILWAQGVSQALHIGGAGAADAVVISGVTAVMMCELLGETVERMTRSRAAGHTRPAEGGHSA
ncbi:MAG: DUF1614 domain-containing protein [Clostridia bacterium]|nr:DUF1614 domain-containing protein [Clostridia bacterium]